MPSGPQVSWNRDVFICFSKARPGEARVALAIKDELEQLGLSAFEYEDWSWVGTSAAGEVDVDRRRLQTLLDAATTIVLITPHEGAPSTGVETELDELRASGRAVIVVTWSPRGWQPLLEPQLFEGLNVIWTHQGTSTRENSVDDKQSAYVGQKVAEAAWLAHHLHLLYRDHATTAGVLLKSIPEGPFEPLQNLRIVRPQLEQTSWGDFWPDDDTLADLAQITLGKAGDAELVAFQKAWRDGRNVAAQELTATAGAMSRTFKLFNSTCDILLRLAVARCGETDTVEAQYHRGLMLARFGRDAEAVATLHLALENADASQRATLHQALALAQGDDAGASVQAVSVAIEHSTQPEMTCLLKYQRGLLHSKAEQYGLAVADYTFTADYSQSPQLYQSALLGRGLAHTKSGNDEDAIVDYTRVISRASKTPRLAVSAWQDRGRIYRDQKRFDEAFADWKFGIEHADATEEQRFRILELRAELLERIGDPLRAAEDYAAMAKYSNASREYREKLIEKAAKLRSAPKQLT